MRNLLSRWLALVLAACSGLASASPLISLDLVSPKQRLSAGETFFVSVQISGLRTAGLDAVVGAFNLEVSFNGGDVTAFDAASPAGFGTALGDPALGEAITFADFSSPGVVRLAEVSLLDQATLGDLQSDSFIVATIGFMLRDEPALTLQNFVISQFDLADAFAQPITDDTGAPVPVETGVLTLKVPVPPTLPLAALGLLAALALTRRATALRRGARGAAAVALAALVLPAGLVSSVNAAEVSPAKAAQATFAGASAWAVREDRNHAAYAKALVLDALWDQSPTLRANPGAMAAAVQQKWDQTPAKDEPLGRRLARAVNAGVKSLGREAGSMAEKLRDKTLAQALPVVDDALLDKSGRAMKHKRGPVSPIDASLVLEDEFHRLAQRAGDRRFVQAYNQVVGTSLGVLLGLGEAATRQQRPTYNAALEGNADVRAMRNAKGGFTIGESQAVGAIKVQMSSVAQISSAVKVDIGVLVPLQSDMVAYMGDATLRATQRTRLQQAAQAHQAKLDAARATTHLLKAALATDNPKLAQQVGVLRRAHHRVAESSIGYAKAVADLGKAPNLPPASARMAATVHAGQLLGAAADLFSLYAKQQAPNAAIAGHVRALGQEIRSVPSAMKQHHDRMDRVLSGIYGDLGTQLGKLQLATTVIQQQIGEIQSRLLAIEDQISSLERHLVTILQESALQDFLVQQDTALGYKARTNLTMTLPAFDAYQVLFRSWADQMACSATFVAPAAGAYTAAILHTQLVDKGYTLDENVDFLVKYADAVLGQPGIGTACAGSARLPNPKVWLLGANAYLQLARENPWYAARTERNNPQALVSVIATGTVLKNALHGLSSGDAATGRRGIFFHAIDGYGARSAQLVAALGASGQDLTPLAQQVSGYLALLKALMTLGLPRSLAENDFLNALIAGGQALPSGEDILQLHAQGVSAATLQATINGRRTALRAELVEIFQALDNADVVELQPAVQSLLDELEERRSVSQALATGDFYSARAGSALRVPAGAVLANDAHPFPADTVNSAVKARLWIGPGQGVLTWPRSNDGSFVYQPAAGFTGQVGFTYKASDGVVDGEEATVTIRVGDYGDLNGDGAVDVADLSLLMALIGTDVDAATLDKADLNADGVVNALDAKALTWICSKPACAR
jgi:hypothetical protein